jgi:hypothetical protein
MSSFVATGILFASGIWFGRPSPSIDPSGVVTQQVRPVETRAQEGSLARALALFGGADSNHDGRLTAEEARSLPVSAEAFASDDADRDGFWSREEFLLFYRRQLVAFRQPVGADLDAEITRIQALKRVEAVDPARKPKCETSARTADPGSLNLRFETILADVESKCAARRAGREDFQRLRNLVVLNGRAAARGAATPGASSPSAMLDAIDRIEKHSVQGQYARDEFEALRRAPIAENVATPTPLPNPVSRDAAEAPETARPAAKSAVLPTHPAPATPPSSAAPAQIGPAPTPPGPAAGRQRASPAPATPPKAPPHPAPIRPSNDPSDRSKP